MAPASTFTPKASLSQAPTNLKEAIDWVLRVTGKDGKKNDECICGLAAAVTDLLQSVQLEYHGYQGDTKETDGNKGATYEQVKEHLNGLFSLVQGLGGTAVVRTYIDQLAQVLSALVGWSKIEQCKGCEGKGGDSKPHGDNNCKYLEDIEPENKCDTCGCMKWVVIKGIDWAQLGRGCKKCASDEEAKKPCQCSPGGCQGAGKCKCAKAGRCCRCCCKSCSGKCNEKGCICDKEKKDTSYGDEYRIHSYTSAYPHKSILVQKSFLESKRVDVKPFWRDLTDLPACYPGSASERRAQCAQILLGSVCLIWSGLTYMYWTGKYHSSSPRWNNHILDGTGLDDGTLSQWLQALGFPRDMLNNYGPKNRLDQVIWDGLSDKLLLGFAKPTGATGSDKDGNTARGPAGMNYPGLVHTIHRDSFNESAIVFKDGTNKDKIGALFKLYILSCAYFTGLQRKTSESATLNTSTNTPKTIREVLYWLSALPYSQAYKDMLGYAKERLAEVLKKPGDNASTTEQSELNFHQTGRWHPITVHQYNLFAHFQAVTQYCPLVLIGIQGGLNSTKGTKEPAIHSLYANTECQFTYPTVSIQAYNQVVHYIRALFYQLYFLRKQCAVKVTCGGKWRECRYGSGVVSKGVISWMCLGCDPMEHDRRKRVGKVNGVLDGVVKKVKASVQNVEDGKKLVEVLKAIGGVVVQLGNAQQVLEKDINNESLAVTALRKVEGVNGSSDLNGVLDKVLEKLMKEKVEVLETEVDGEEPKDDVTKAKVALEEAKSTVQKDGDKKNKLNAAHYGLRQALDYLAKGFKEAVKNDNVIDKLSDWVKETVSEVIEDLISICNSPKCPSCKDHKDKCGQTPKPSVCDKCHQQYMDGFPSPLQAFLEDRLPGFSCNEVVNNDTDKDTVYPPAASHLGHCNGSGQCCPLPMGFRGQFQKGSIRDMTGARLYGLLYFFSNENMMQSCVYTLVRVTAALSATTPQVLGDVFGFFRGGVGNKDRGKTPNGSDDTQCQHEGDPSGSYDENKTKYFCGWCASGLRDEVKKIEWIPNALGGKDYRTSVGTALIDIKGDKGDSAVPKGSTQNTTALSRLTENCQYLSPLTGELYTAVSATFGGTYLSWVLYLSDALQWGLQSLYSEFQQIECRGCKGQCDPNKCKKGSHGEMGSAQCNCSSIVSCTGVLPVLYRHGFSYGNPFNLEGYEQRDKDSGDYSIQKKDDKKQCHQFLDSLGAVIDKNKQDQATSQDQHPLTELLKQVGQLQYDIRLPWIFVLTIAWLVAVLYLAFGAIWPLDWTHMRSHWLRGGEHQWQCMWYKVMTGRKGMELVEYFGRR